MGDGAEKNINVLMINILMINMVEQFFDRERELGFLEKEYRRSGFSFIIIYGRRRVGKTFLVKKFLSGKRRAIYIYVSEMSSSALRAQIADELRDRLGLRLGPLPTWADIFRGLFRRSRRSRGRIVAVFDEFQRLLEVDRSALTELQRVIDEEAQGSSLMLVCTGSSIGLMERMFQYGQPLYGRATGFLKIRPFDFRTAYRYLSRRVGAGPVEAAELYGVFGGTPYYLSLLRSKDWAAEAERLVLDNRSPLYWEPELLLKTELREHVTYFEILRLLSSGKNSFSEIAGSLGASKTSLSYYLHVLIDDLDVVEREKPLGGGRAVYRIKDNFFKFWFRYVFPNRGALELGEKGEVLEAVKEDFNTYMGHIYQEIAGQAIWSLDLPFKPFRVGRWWRKDVEIDLVALDRWERQAAVFEVKWRKLNGREALRVLRELEAKAARLPYPRKLYGLIAVEVEKEPLEGYLAYDIRDVAGAAAGQG